MTLPAFSQWISLPHYPSNRETAMLDSAMASPGFRPVFMPHSSCLCSGCGRYSSVTVARLRRSCTGLPFHGKIIYIILYIAEGTFSIFKLTVLY